MILQLFWNNRWLSGVWQIANAKAGITYVSRNVLKACLPTNVWYKDMFHS